MFRSRAGKCPVRREAERGFQRRACLSGMAQHCVRGGNATKPNPPLAASTKAQQDSDTTALTNDRLGRSQLRLRTLQPKKQRERLSGVSPLSVR